MQGPINGIKVLHTEERLSPSKHIVYILLVKGPVKSWTVAHRFNDFQALNLVLGSEHALPSKIYFADAQKLQHRKDALEQWLQLVLSSKTTEPVWYDFLNLPLSARKATINLKADIQQLDAGSWLVEYYSLSKFLVEIKTLLLVRDRNANNDVHAYQTAKLNSRKAVTAAAARHQNLVDCLENRDKGVLQISAAEQSRRADLALNLKNDLNDIETDALKSDVSHQKDNVLSSRAELLNNDSRSKRKFGLAKETSETRALDNAGLVLMQQQILKQQDTELEALQSVVSRQREIGLAISDELDAQNILLDELDEGVDRVQTQLEVADKRIKKFLQ